jgi:hypothetical protein
MGIVQQYYGVMNETFRAGVTNHMPAGTSVPQKGFGVPTRILEYS